MENNEDVDLMLRDGEKMVLVENASVLSRRRLAATIAAPAAAVFADDIMMLMLCTHSSAEYRCKIQCRIQSGEYFSDILHRN